MTSDTRDERPAMLPGEVRESNATNPNYRLAANLQADEALGPAVGALQLHPFGTSLFLMSSDIR